MANLYKSRGYEISVDVRGPLFNGRVGAIAAEYVDQANYAVATRAEDMVRRRLAQMIRHRTPYYETRIQVVRAGRGYEVNDGGVIYGPWLEGVGSRNYPVTRFRGYSAFRRAKALIQTEARTIVQNQKSRYTGRM
jgi:hypothetical protein